MAEAALSSTCGTWVSSAVRSIARLSPRGSSTASRAADCRTNGSPAATTASTAQAVAAAGLATLGLRAAARAQLASVEELVSRVPPRGRIGAQTYVAGGDPSDENIELPIAQLYVLEALCVELLA